MAEPNLLLFGAPRLATASGPVAFAAERRFQLLAYLALDGGWVERERLGTLFWPDLDHDAARRNVRKIVHRARQSDWLQGLDAEGEFLRWRVGTDVADFRVCLAQSRPLDAHRLYRGPLLLGLDDAGNAGFSAWLEARRTHLHLQWRDAALAALPLLPTPALRVDLAQRLGDDDPLDERALLAQLAALREAGRDAEADALYRGHLHRLAEELGIEPSARVREAGRGGTAHRQAPVPTDLHEGGSAAATSPADPFVGRRLELQELLALLERPGSRVVTLSGAGGVGKSRLAREAMPQLAPQLDCATHWIALEDLPDEAAALGRLGAALGVRLHDNADAAEQIALQCAGRNALVVLDNAEHLAGLAVALRRLLDAWPGLRLLITSRRRLGLADEWLLPLDGLAVPDADSRDAEAAVHFDAVRLFELRARRSRPDFDLDRHLDAVITIVERVDGLPLAIEMAAAWVRLLPPEEIVRDLGYSLQVLQQPADGTAAAPRHASMQIVLEQSWRLLAPSERLALARLCMFRGGFRHDAATAVAGASLPLLASLVDKSLLAVDNGGRFGMHPLVAQFAAGQLDAEPGAAARAARAHAEYWSQRLDALAPVVERDRPRVLDEVGSEYANCAAAWRHAAATVQPGLLLAMLPALLALFSASGRHREGCQLLREALAEPSPARTAQMLRAHLLTALAALHYLCGDPRDAEALSRAGLALARELGQRELTLRSLVHLGICLNLRGHADAARPVLEEALAGARTFGERNRLANVLFNVAHNERLLGNFARAAALVEDALALWRETGNADGVACAQVAAGNLLRIDGQYVASRTLLAEALATCRAQGLAARERQARMTLGHTLVFLGEHEAAREHLEACRRDSEQAGQVPMWVLAELRLARLELAADRLAAARDHCRSAFAAARARALDGFAAEALCLHAQACAANGDDARARQLWRLLQRSTLLERSERDLAAQRLGTPDGAAGANDEMLDLDAAAHLLDPDPAG
jgi:predicted ATPase/DNA-binding SARP family transcriptional activator